MICFDVNKHLYFERFAKAVSFRLWSIINIIFNFNIDIDISNEINLNMLIPMCLLKIARKETMYPDLFFQIILTLREKVPSVYEFAQNLLLFLCKRIWNGLYWVNRFQSLHRMKIIHSWVNCFQSWIGNKKTWTFCWNPRTVFFLKQNYLLDMIYYFHEKI